MTTIHNTAIAFRPHDLEDRLARVTDRSEVPDRCPAYTRQLLKELHGLLPALEPHTLQPGTRLFGEGSTVPAVWIIECGLVALRRSDRGRATTLMLLRGGDIVGDVPLITNNHAQSDAVVLLQTRVLPLSEHEFWRLISSSSRFARLWTAVSACRLAAHQDRLVDMLAGDIRAQVASLLLHEFTRSDSVRLSHRMIADLLGVQRSSVTRTVRQLVQRGIVDGGYAQLRLRNRRALAKAALGYVASAP
jgi:CRP-like cAMP-binding protein